MQFSRTATAVATVTLDGPDQCFFNAVGGAIGIDTQGVPSAILDDVGGGTVRPEPQRAGQVP